MIGSAEACGSPETVTRINEWMATTTEMDTNTGLPDMRFRTYLTVHRVRSDSRKIRYYVQPSLKLFRPPVAWGLDRPDFKRMITLQDGVFYNTELSTRPQSYVIVPAELTADVRERTGLTMFTFMNHESYPCYPAR